jgi:hemolysin III
MEPEELRGRLVYYSEAEELVNRFTHGIGTLLSLVGAIALISLAAEQHDRYRLISACVYGGAMVVFYGISTLYHSVRKPYVRYLLNILDHSSIYLMIAGSYTPFALVSLRGPWGWSLLVTVWVLGTVGAVLKFFTVHRLPTIGPFIYLALGWSLLLAWKPLVAALEINGMLLLLAGGAAYTVGVLFYLWDRLPYNHAIWHLFVLTGSACHFFSIFYYVTPNHL